MTPARILATALLCSLAVACGESGPGEDGELPTAFTIVVAGEDVGAGCPNTSMWTIRFEDVRSASPRFVGGTAPSQMGTCGAPTTQGEVMAFDCESEDAGGFQVYTTFVVDPSGAGTMGYEFVNTMSGERVCMATYTITSYTDDTPDA